MNREQIKRITRLQRARSSLTKALASVDETARELERNAPRFRDRADAIASSITNLRQAITKNIADAAIAVRLADGGRS